MSSAQGLSIAFKSYQLENQPDLIEESLSDGLFDHTSNRGFAARRSKALRQLGEVVSEALPEIGRSGIRAIEKYYQTRLPIPSCFIQRRDLLKRRLPLIYTNNLDRVNAGKQLKRYRAVRRVVRQALKGYRREDRAARQLYLPTVRSVTPTQPLEGIPHRTRM